MAKMHHSGLGRAAGTSPADSAGDPNARLHAVAQSSGVAALTQALHDSSPEVARAAIRRLVELEGSGAAAPLRAALLDADVALVADLAKALHGLGDANAVELALGSLTDEPYTHRLAAVIALGICGDRDTRPSLCRALGDQISAVRAAALQALMRLGPDHEAVQQAVPLLRDPSAQVRLAAVRMIAGHHPAPATALATVVEDPDPEVRAAVAGHLEVLNEADARRLLADTEMGVRCQAVCNAGSEYLDALGKLLTDEDRGDIRCATARALGSIGGARAAEELIAGIEDRDSVVRACVLHALEQAVTRAGAIERLARELESLHARRRQASLYALARLEAGERDALIWKLADDTDLDVRLTVVQTADALLAEPEPLLMYLRTDPNVEVRESAERRLAKG